MLIVGENLQYLIDQHQIVENVRSYDVNSITLTLDRNIVYFEPDSEDDEITYGNSIPEKWIVQTEMNEDGFLLKSKSNILGCSHEVINIPKGYFGLLQTKGSLARLFVSINCCDGQIEAGYKGKITFEISNLANFGVRLKYNQEVGQLFIFKTSSRLVKPYSGRYQGAEKPTFQIPPR